MGETVLVLREAASGRRTAEALARRGHAAVLLPVERVEETGEAPPPGPFAGFAVTSRHAVPRLARAFPRDSRPVFAVGGATAALLRGAGFPAVVAGEGRAGRLGALARARLPVEPAPLLYAAGTPRTGTLEAGLAAAGLGFVAWEAYRTVALDPAEAAIEAALGGAAGPVGAALILSAGQAEGFARLCRRAGTRLDPRGLRLLCLSERIAAALGTELAARAETAAAPSLDALLDRIG